MYPDPLCLSKIVFDFWNSTRILEYTLKKISINTRKNYSLAGVVLVWWFF